MIGAGVLKIGAAASEKTSSTKLALIVPTPFELSSTFITRMMMTELLSSGNPA